MCKNKQNPLRVCEPGEKLYKEDTGNGKQDTLQVEAKGRGLRRTGTAHGRKKQVKTWFCSAGSFHWEFQKYFKVNKPKTELTGLPYPIPTSKCAILTLRGLTS